MKNFVTAYLPHEISAKNFCNPFIYVLVSVSHISVILSSLSTGVGR